MEEDALSLTALFSGLRVEDEAIYAGIMLEPLVLRAVVATEDSGGGFERGRNKVLPTSFSRFFLQRENSNRAKIPWMQMRNFKRTRCFLKGVPVTDRFITDGKIDQEEIRSKYCTK